MTPMSLKGRTALITGAAGGIGRGIALALAKRGCNLALADIKDSSQTAALATAVHTTCHILDVANNDQITALREQILKSHPGLDLLINNAGVALAGRFDELTDEEFDWLFQINFHGAVRMTRTFLPLLKSSPDARIINLSSIFGIIAPPEQSAYAASKFALRGFSESLRHELANTTVGVTTIHPGGVATNIARAARIAEAANSPETLARRDAFNNLLTIDPMAAGEAIIRAAEHRKPRAILGKSAKFAATLERLFPTTCYDKLARLKR